MIKRNKLEKKHKICKSKETIWFYWEKGYWQSQKALNQETNCLVLLMFLKHLNDMG